MTLIKYCFVLSRLRSTRGQFPSDLEDMKKAIDLFKRMANITFKNENVVHIVVILGKKFFWTSTEKLCFVFAVQNSTSLEDVDTVIASIKKNVLPMQRLKVVNDILQEKILGIKAKEQVIKNAENDVNYLMRDLIGLIEKVKEKQSFVDMDELDKKVNELENEAIDFTRESKLLFENGKSNKSGSMTSKQLEKTILGSFNKKNTSIKIYDVIDCKICGVSYYYYNSFWEKYLAIYPLGKDGCLVLISKDEIQTNISGILHEIEQHIKKRSTKQIREYFRELKCNPIVIPLNIRFGQDEKILKIGYNNNGTIEIRYDGKIYVFKFKTHVLRSFFQQNPPSYNIWKKELKIENIQKNSKGQNVKIQSMASIQSVVSSGSFYLSRKQFFDRDIKSWTSKEVKIWCELIFFDKTLSLSKALKQKDSEIFRNFINLRGIGILSNEKIKEFYEKSIDIDIDSSSSFFGKLLKTEIEILRTERKVNFSRILVNEKIRNLISGDIGLREFNNLFETYYKSPNIEKILTKTIKEHDDIHLIAKKVKKNTYLEISTEKSVEKLPISCNEFIYSIGDLVFVNYCGLVHIGNISNYSIGIKGDDYDDDDFGEDGEVIYDVEIEVDETHVDMICSSFHTWNILSANNNQQQSSTNFRKYIKTLFKKLRQ